MPKKVGPKSRLGGLAAIGFAILVYCDNSSVAEQIYRWVGADGQVHYSTEPHPEGAPAALPEIKHENSEQRIKSIRQSTPTNCEKHDSVDCQAGPDTDGSVICMDGYRDAVLVFQNHCAQARLKSDKPKVFGEKNEILTATSAPVSLNGAQRIEVSVRNLASVKASGVEVTVSFPRLPFPIHASGPGEVDSYGFAEYTADLSPARTYLSAQNLKKMRVTIRCSNCQPSSDEVL